MNAARELAKLLGTGKVLCAPKDLARMSRDFAGHDLGRALCVVRPRATEDVRKVVVWARKTKTALTPCGALTSFWAATRVPGRVALDMRGLSRLLSLDAVEGVARVQAGMSVAALDAALGKKGLTLAAAPDGFGDAVVGTLAVNDTVAGLGQFAGPASAQLVGLEVVLGTGEVLRTGASSVLGGLPAFSLHGLPDPTGLFLASEGTLGVVTEVLVRAAPKPLRGLWAAAVPSTADAFARLADAARALRGAPGVERVLFESWVTMRGDSVLVDVSGEDEDALAARAGRVAAEFKRRCLPALARREPGRAGRSGLPARRTGAGCPCRFPTPTSRKSTASGSPPGAGAWRAWRAPRDSCASISTPTAARPFSAGASPRTRRRRPRARSWSAPCARAWARSACPTARARFGAPRSTVASTPPTRAC